MPDLDSLRRKLSPEQRAILNAIWDEYRERNRWLPRATLHAQVGESAVRAALTALGECVLREGREDAGPDYRITFLGVLLTDQGPESEALLVRYLEYVRGRLRADPRIEWVASAEVEQALALSPARSQHLRQLIRLSHWWGGGSGFGQREWTVGVPIDADELPDSELSGYVRRHVLAHFLPGTPGGGLQVLRVPPARPDVPFDSLADAALARRLAADWHEAQDVYQVRGFKSCVLLAGGVLEATLRAVLAQRDAPPSPAAGLVATLDTAVAAGLLPATPLAPLLAGYAALLEPASRAEVTREQADEALRITRACLRHLSRTLSPRSEV